MTRSFPFRIALSLLIVAVFINLLLLDYFFIRNQIEVKNNALFQASNTTSISKTEDKVLQAELACPNSCMKLIQSVSASSQTPSSKTILNSSVKEFFVPFGSGVSTANGFTNVPGLSAYIDTSQYGSIQSVVFEISIQIPTGNEIVWAQLYNVTAGYPVANSQVTMSGGAPQLLVSSPITLTPGNNLYQVQVNTQLQYPANINQARVHITTN